jgi:Glycine zipper 2TM domain
MQQEFSWRVHYAARFKRRRNPVKKMMVAMAASTMVIPTAVYAAPQFDTQSATALNANASAYDSRREREYNRGYREGRREERVSRNTRVWRGDDGRAYCRRKDGTTGLLIGGAVGGLAGNEIAGRGDKTLGTILGVAGGALLGREIDRGGSRCR